MDEEEFDPGAAFTTEECAQLERGLSEAPASAAPGHASSPTSAPPPVLSAPPPVPSAPPLVPSAPPLVPSATPLVPVPIAAKSSSALSFGGDDMLDERGSTGADDMTTTESVMSAASMNGSTGRKRNRESRSDPAPPLVARSRSTRFAGTYRDGAHAASALAASDDSKHGGLVGGEAADLVGDAGSGGGGADHVDPAVVYGVDTPPSAAALALWFSRGSLGRVGGLSGAAGGSSASAASVSAASAHAAGGKASSAAAPETGVATPPGSLPVDIDLPEMGLVEPPLPIDPAVVRRIYDFAAADPRRYTGVPLEIIEGSADVTVTRSPLGFSAVARVPIRKGQRLGWYEGLRVQGDPLVYLHVSAIYFRGYCGWVRVNLCESGCCLVLCSPTQSPLRGERLRKRVQRQSARPLHLKLSSARPRGGLRTSMTCKVRQTCGVHHRASIYPSLPRTQALAATPMSKCMHASASPKQAGRPCTGRASKHAETFPLACRC